MALLMGVADGGSSGFRGRYEIDVDFSWTGMDWHLSVRKREPVGLLLRSPFVVFPLLTLRS